MEEADILADNIAIMAKGRLKAIGKSIRLKNKFGTGYRISLIITNGEQVAAVKKRISEVCAEAKLDEEEYVGGSPTDTEKERALQSCRLVYVVNQMDTVKQLISYLETSSKSKQTGNAADEVAKYITSFGMSQTTLEDVFLSMVKD
jgi:ABC-type multidrug transport system ATPase subunit